MSVGLLSPQIIVRADPVRWFDDLVVSPAVAVALMTGDDSTPSGLGTTLRAPPGRSVLDLEVRFLNAGSSLAVQLGDKVLKSIDANKIGVRQRLQVPIDLTSKTTYGNKPVPLTVALRGPAGSLAHIGTCRFPARERTPLDPKAWGLHGRQRQRRTMAALQVSSRSVVTR